MDENNPPKDTPSSSGTPPVTTEDKGNGAGSKGKPPVSKQDEAYREQQSRADKAASSSDEFVERLDFLESMASDQMRDTAINDFLSEKAKDFPNVSTDDLKRFATSPDELETTAKYLQDKHDEIKQSTLAEARNVPDGSMTAQQKEEAKKALNPSTDRGAFGKWFGIQSTKTRK